MSASDAPAQPGQLNLPALAVFTEQRLGLLATFGYLALALLVSALVPLLAHQWLHTPFIGAFVEPALFVSQVAPAQPGSWALAGAGLPKGYRLQAVAGAAVSDAGELAQALQRYAPGASVNLTLADPSGAAQEVTVILQAFPAADVVNHLYLPYFTGLVYLLCGLLVFGLRRKEPAGRACAVFCASVAIGLIAWFDVNTTHQLTYLWTAALPLAGGALLNLALLFPEPIPQVEHFPWLRRLGYLPALVLILNALPAVNRFAAPASHTLAWRLSFAFTGLSALFFLGWMGARRYTALSPIVREQSRLVLWGGGLACAPPLAWYLIHSLFPSVYFSALFLLFLIIFPLFTIYTLLRYRLVDSDYLLSRAALYALLTILAGFGYAFLVSGASLLLGEFIPADNPYLIGLMVIALALALNPLRQYLQTFIDRTFFHGKAAYRDRLQAFSRDLAQVTDMPAVVRLLRQTIEPVLLPTQLHIYVHDSLSDHYVAAPDERGRPTSDIRFPTHSALTQAMRRRQAPIFLGQESTLPIILQAERARLVLLAAQLYVPLPGRQHLAGWLALGNRRSGEPYRRDDLAFLEALAGQAAVALERGQVIADLERRVNEMNVLTRVAEGINITLAFDDLLELIFTQTNRLIPSRDFRITLKDVRGLGVYHAFFLENDERLPERENQLLPLGRGLEIEVIRTQRAIQTDDYERECRGRGLLPDAPGLFAWTGLPLNAGTETIGAVSLGSRDPAATFSLEQQNLLQAIADLAAGSIIKARLLEETSLHARQVSTLNEVARSLTSTLEIDPLLNNILQSAMDILGCESGSLLLVDENTGESVFTVAVGPVGAELVGKRLPPGAGLVGKAIQTGKPIIQNDARRTREWYNTDQQTGYVTQDLLVVPMQVKGRIIGVLEVLNKRDGLPFSADDQELLTAFAGQAAVAIENARLYTLTDQALAARVEELSVMQRIDRELNASLEIERALRITLEWALRQSRADAGLVGLVSEDGIRLMASQGYEGSFGAISEGMLPLTNPALRAAVQIGHPQYLRLAPEASAQQTEPVKDSASPAEATVDLKRLPAEPDYDFDLAEEQFFSPDQALLPGAQTLGVVPIRREAAVIGLLLLESLAPGAFPAEIQAFLSRLSDHAAIAVANAQLYAAVQIANQAKSAFVSAAAHELKNPLTSIKGYSDLLVAGVVGSVNEAQANFLATIRSNAERMALLVSDLQDLSRIEAGQLRLKFNAWQLPEMIDEVVQSFKRQVDEKGQSIQVTLPAGLPLVWCDRDRLIQILTNLFSNAHKYSPSGGLIRLWVENLPHLSASAGAPQIVHVAVQDNGIGMTPEDQKKVFQQFFRSDDPKVREVSGTGLGLSITKNLVELQGGQIWFESIHQFGTTFHFTVPVAETQD